MVHRPQVSPLAGNRDLGGNLKLRTGQENQSMAGGGRYNPSVLQKLAEADSKKALKKAQQKKIGKTETGAPAEPVILNPDKNTVQNFN